MPVDIFPEMDIPVVSVVWTYAGMDAQDIQNRILTLHERQMASLVDDISRIEATSYQGVGVVKVLSARRRRCHPRGVAARQQRPGGAEVHASEHHPATGDPLWRHRRPHHPTEPVEQVAARHQAQRPRAEHHPAGARRRARRGGAVSLRRQAARHHGRPRSRRRSSRAA